MRKVSYLRFIILAAMLGFTIAVGVNNVNAGIYADAHQLGGASVGWFAPHGMDVFAISALATIGYIIYLFVTRRRKA